MNLRSFRPGRLGAPATLLCALVVTAASCKDATGGGGGGGPAAIVWRTPVADKFAGTISVPQADADRMYVTGTGLAAFDLRTGAPVWKTGPFTQSIPAYVSVQGGRVLAAEAAAFAFDAATGRELWRTLLDGDASLSENTADERAFYVGTRTHRVYALGLESGAPLWVADLGMSWPAESLVKGIAVSGDTVYATVERPYSANGFLSAGVIVALDRGTGRELWRYQNGAGDTSRGVIGAPTVAGRLLLASDHKGNAFFAVDRFTGAEVWRTPTQPGAPGPEARPVVADGVAYASGADTYVYSLELATGRVIWKTRPAMGSSVFHAVCGGAVFNNFQGLGIVDRAGGRLLGTMFDGDNERVTSGFAVRDGMIFFVTHRAAYALRCP